MSVGASSARDRTLARGFARYMSDARAATVLDANPLAGASLLLLVVALGAGVVWAHQAELDEVTRANGRIIPSSREQVIQSLEGGILDELLVAEGDVVERGEVLLRIDDTRFSAVLRESESQQQALRGAIARLEAEAEGASPRFPADLRPETVALESELFRSRKQGLDQSVEAVRRSLKLAEEELGMTAPLVDRGIVSEVEVLRLRRQVNELKGKIRDRQNSFRSDAQGELATKKAALSRIFEVNAAREDQVDRAVVRAPMRGTVKNIRLSTIGGVIQPGSDIMEIVPLDDRLFVEARVRPSDVAFLRPGLPAKVKITAYDFAIYGGLDGILEHISADTLVDERSSGEAYYKVRVSTDVSHLRGPDGPLPVIAGMTATVEILTGSKTVLEYILKPVLRARDQALRER